MQAHTVYNKQAMPSKITCIRIVHYTGIINVNTGIHDSVCTLCDKKNLDRCRPEGKYLVPCSLGVAVHVDQDVDAVCIDSVSSHSIVRNLKRRKMRKVCTHAHGEGFFSLF